MIKQISAKNLKGLKFSHKIGPKTIIIGNNGTGKTAAIIALQLAVKGYVPGGSARKNPDILANFGTDGKLEVGIANGIRLQRVWKMDSKGAVPQTYLVDTKKAGKDKFIAGLVEIGKPVIFDVETFWGKGVSDQSRINMVFNLYPPAGDLAAIDEKIEELTEKKNSLQSKIRDKQNSIAEITAQRSRIEKPAGTLADTKAELKDLNNKLSDAQESLKKAEIAEAEEKAAEKAKQEAEEAAARAREEEQKKAAAEPPAEPPEIFDQGPHTVASEIITSDDPKEIWPEKGNDQGMYDESGAVRNDFRPQGRFESGGVPIVKNPAAVSIQKIIETMQSVECGTCAAMLVAKVELRKFK